MNTLLLIVLAYALGSIPNALWIGKVFKNIDVREHGSKNTGSTNAARVLGAKLGLFTLILDILKGSIPTLLALNFSTTLSKLSGISMMDAIVVGLVSILGHTYSIYLNFKGGKAVATTLGVFAVLAPYAILILIIVFFTTFGFSKYVSLASIISATILPIAVYITTGHIVLTVFSAIIGLLVVLRHKGNIERIKNGTESKFSLKKQERGNNE